MQIIKSNEHVTNVHSVERLLSFFAGTSLVAAGIRKKGRSGLIPLATGAVLINRGATGHCGLYRALGVQTDSSGGQLQYETNIRASASVTIRHPRDRIFQFWKQLENLPRFMRHLISVNSDGRCSHWVAEGPGGSKFEWDAEILREIENELISWQSLPGGDVTNAGTVRFLDAPKDRGTEVHVDLQYHPPGGVAAAHVARLLGREPEQEIRADLTRLKQFLETGEVATTKGQARGPYEKRRIGGVSLPELPSIDKVLP